MGVSGQVRRNMNYYAYDIARLPDPNTDDGSDGTFYLSEVHLDMSRLHQLWHDGLVSPVSDSGLGGGWTVDDDAYTLAQAYLDRTDQETLPCNHTAVYNIPGGGFECGECGRPITREQAEAVLG